jgi:6-phosphogluconolactonase
MKCHHALNFLLLFALVIPGSISGAESKPAPKISIAEETRHALIYVGTYTGAKSKGIYLYRMELNLGGITSRGIATEVASPSFLAIHPNKKFLYAVSEVGDFEGKPTGAINAFAIQPRSGRLTLLNKQSSGGNGPCHLAVDASGKMVMAANYGGGSVISFPIKDDGSLGEKGSFIQHSGSSVNRQRQAGPHAHGIAVDAANHFAFVADLGLDRVLAYKITPEKGTMMAHSAPWTQIAAGSGPRHLAFHPTGKWMYVINELNSTIDVLQYNSSQGRMTQVQTMRTLPSNSIIANSTAEIEVHPSGLFLYGSNRGHDSLAIFAIDPATGKLKNIGHQSTLGKTPRNFSIDPTGRFILVANQDSNNLVAFRIDLKTGLLSPTTQTIEIGTPVCIKFLME